jgi:hypothetical protein
MFGTYFQTDLALISLILERMSQASLIKRGKGGYADYAKTLYALTIDASLFYYSYHDRMYALILKKE